MMVDAKRGRPRRRAPKPGERVPLGLRVTPKLKKALDQAAESSGRSQSQEAEFRLERSFADQELLIEALELAYGRGLAGMLLTVGEIMKAAGPSSGFLLAVEDGGVAVRDWWDSPYAFDQAMKGAAFALDTFRPEGEIKPPQSLGQKLCENMGVAFARGILSEIASGEPTTTSAIERAPRLRRGLGVALVSRIKKSISG